MKPPSREELIQRVAQMMYGQRILNNSHRGDLAEGMVISALDPEWNFVGLGWHPWDLQRGSGPDRIRIQVKQIAALQLWGETKRLTLRFGWKSSPPDYFERDNPNEEIESEGWFCEVFVFGLHLEDDESKVDQADANQWQFLVIPASDLEPPRDSMVLTKALDIWEPVSWAGLSEKVDEAITRRDQNDAG